MTDHVEHVELADLLAAAAAFLGHEPEIRDVGLLESALARPRASAFGEDAYPDLDQKAAALLLSLVTNYGLIDGNKRLGWFGVQMLYGLNGHELVASIDDEYDLIIGIASGDIQDVVKVAETLRLWR